MTEKIGKANGPGINIGNPEADLQALKDYIDATFMPGPILYRSLAPGLHSAAEAQKNQWRCRRLELRGATVRKFQADMEDELINGALELMYEKLRSNPGPNNMLAGYAMKIQDHLYPGRPQNLSQKVDTVRHQHVSHYRPRPQGNFRRAFPRYERRDRNAHGRGSGAMPVQITGAHNQELIQNQFGPVTYYTPESEPAAGVVDETPNETVDDLLLFSPEEAN